MRYTWVQLGLAATALSGCNNKGSENELSTKTSGNSAVKNAAYVRHQTAAIVPIRGDTYSPSVAKKDEFHNIPDYLDEESTILFELPPEANGNPDFYLSEDFISSQFAEFKSFLDKLFISDIVEMRMPEELAQARQESAAPQEPLEEIPSGDMQYEETPIDSVQQVRDFQKDAATKFLFNSGVHDFKYDVIRYAIPVVLKPNVATMWYLVWIAYAPGPSKIDDAISRFRRDYEQGQAWTTDKLPYKRIIGATVQQANGTDTKMVPNTFDARVRPIVFSGIKRRLSLENRRVITAAGRAYYVEGDSSEDLGVVEKSDVVAYKNTGIRSNVVPN